LRMAYEYGTIGQTNTTGIVNVGDTLQKVGKALEARGAVLQAAAPPPVAEACRDYITAGKNEKECRASIIHWTLEAAREVAAHAGADGEDLLTACAVLETMSSRIRI